MHYYQHHVGDYNRDTGDLSVTEHGVYRLLMDVYYVTERPLPADLTALCRLCRAMNSVEKRAVESVANRFFSRDADNLVHKRIAAELELYKTKGQQSRDNGKRGGRPRKTQTQEEPRNNPAGYFQVTQEEPSDNPEQKVTINHKPLTKPPSPLKGESLRDGKAEGFEQFWKAYPNRKSKGEAAKVWANVIKTTPAETIMSSLERVKAGYDWTKDNGQFIPYPAKWLRRQGWHDEPSQPPPSNSTQLPHTTDTL